MPWTPDSFRSKHNHGLSDAAATRGAAAANSVLNESGDEGKAVRIGNAVAAGTVKHSPYKSNRGKK